MLKINGNDYRAFIHGTTEENAKKIQETGFFDSRDIDTVWTCSDNRMLYCREVTGLGMEYEDEDYEPMQACLENAQIASAYYGSRSDVLGLVWIYVPTDILDEIAEEDCSCENMSDCFQLDKEEIDRYISDPFNPVYYQVDYFEKGYYPDLRPFYLANLMSDYMVIKDDMLAEAVKVLKNSEAYLEDLYYTGDRITERHFSTLPLILHECEEVIYITENSKAVVLDVNDEGVLLNVLDGAEGKEVFLDYDILPHAVKIA